MTKRPNSRVNLDKAIERNFGSYRSSTEIRSIMAGAIVGQLLEAGCRLGRQRCCPALIGNLFMRPVVERRA